MDNNREQISAESTRKPLSGWTIEYYNIHRKNQNDEQTNEKPTRPGDD